MAGLLDNARAEHVVPKIFYVNTAYEYWSRGASLIHTSPDGKLDVPIPPEVRIYFIAGVAHTPSCAAAARSGTTPRSSRRATCTPFFLMARGFESKAVESNRQDAEEDRARGRGERIDIHEIERRQKREGLELSRRRILHEMETADERRRLSLQAALAHLDSELAKVQ